VVKIRFLGEDHLMTTLGCSILAQHCGSSYEQGLESAIDFSKVLFKFDGCVSEDFLTFPFLGY
jgi:hypothetical protein